jgi:spore maturation protein CgeB
MRIQIVDSYYPSFLRSHYAATLGLKKTTYENQLRHLLLACFGVSDSYSKHLTQLGCQASDLIVNCAPLQKQWGKENNLPISTLAMQLPSRVVRLPLVNSYLNSLPGLLDAAIAQVRQYKPDVLFCHNLSFFPGKVLKQLKDELGLLIVGQIACPPPSDSFLQGYDLILTSFPHFVSRFRNLGLASEYFRLAFDQRVLSYVEEVPRDISASFVGGITPNHTHTLPLLENLAINTAMTFYGYGASTLPDSSRVATRHKGEVWGLDMYRILARSRLTLNRHIDISECYANNMRMYEATGMGAMLLTDNKLNLNELFNIGSECVVYNSVGEAVELVRYYTDHPEEADAIARAGQARTLGEHTYRHRMQELIRLLQHYL